MHCFKAVIHVTNSNVQTKAILHLILLHLRYVKATCEAKRCKQSIQNPNTGLSLPNSWTGTPLASVVTVAGVLDHDDSAMFCHISVSRVNCAATSRNSTQGEELEQAGHENNGLGSIEMISNGVFLKTKMQNSQQKIINSK